VVASVTEYNAVGVANLVHAFAPERIHIGGAVARNNPEAVVAPLRERLPDRVMTSCPEIQLTPLGDEVVVRGALVASLGDG
jgi:glucokinase